MDDGIVRTPYMFSFAYLAILAAMGWELSNDVLNAAQFASDLRESERRMSLADRCGQPGHLDPGFGAQRNMGDRQMARLVRL